jgi:hypothetical protein
MLFPIDHRIRLTLYFTTTVRAEYPVRFRSSSRLSAISLKICRISSELLFSRNVLFTQGSVMCKTSFEPFVVEVYLSQPTLFLSSRLPGSTLLLPRPRYARLSHAEHH